MTHQTETIYRFPLRFNLNALRVASDATEIDVEVDEGKGFQARKCNAGHVRACLRTFGIRGL